MKASPIPAGIITLIRQQHVIVDADLAILYGVTTARSTRPSSATARVSRRPTCFA
jgi:hypothetical protein